MWTAHTYNVAYSDELGHFENYLALDTATMSNCVTPGAQDPTLDEDDSHSVCVEVLSL